MAEKSDGGSIEITRRQTYLFANGCVSRSGRLPALFLALAFIAGCDRNPSVPVHSGLSIEGFNYAPFHLSRFSVSDEYGNKATGGGQPVPAFGASSRSCCFKLKGRVFTVKWDAYDPDKPISVLHREAAVYLLPSRAKHEGADGLLGVHFYPDNRVQLKYGSDTSGISAPNAEIDGRLSEVPKEEQLSRLTDHNPANYSLSDHQRRHWGLGSAALQEAMIVRAMITRMESMAIHAPDAFARFSVVTGTDWENKKTYKLSELITAYRQLVPHKTGPEVQAHVEVFLRWLAVRSQLPAFHKSTTGRTDEVWRQHLERTRKIHEAQEMYNAERRRVPSDLVAQGNALARLRASQEEQVLALPGATLELSRTRVTAWDRIAAHAAQELRRLPLQNGLKQSADRIRAIARDMEAPYSEDMEGAAKSIEASVMSQEALAFARAWKDSAEGQNPLSDEVMALFDILVHDTTRTQRLSPLLPSRLNFQAGPNNFGVSAKKTENKLHAP